MASRQSALLPVLALVLLSACGGGSTTGAVVEPMNVFEVELVGEYQLADFRILRPGRLPLVPEGTEGWDGRLVLGDDGFATVTLDLGEEDGLGRASCERTFRWQADAGLLRLVSEDPGLPDVLVTWGREGMGTLRTTSFLPTNVEHCGFLLEGAGGETFSWVRTSS